MSTWQHQDRTLELIVGDITQETVDVIVNSANERLGGGFGVDEAIHRAAGPELLFECLDFPMTIQEVRCPTGEAVTTGAYGLSAQYVVHTVGPDWRGGHSREAELLASAHHRALEQAHEVKAESVAFPAISCGIFGYPIEEAAPVSLKAITDHLKSPTTVKQVRLVLFSKQDYQVFAQALSALPA